MLSCNVTAVNGNKHRALQVILDILRQRRELVGAIDVVDEGACLYGVCRYVCAWCAWCA
jgi:hypothetical protein